MGNVYIKGVQLPDVLKVNDMIDAKLSEQSTGNETLSGGQLNYLGHYASIDSLPSTGQTSGERKTYHFNLLTDFLNNNNEESPLLVEGYNYIFSTRKSNGHYAYVATNYPEIIEGVNILEFEDFIGVSIKVNATSDKPAIIHQIADGNGPLYYDSSKSFHYDSSSPVVITESCCVYLSRMEIDSWISSNIPIIKYTYPYSQKFFFYNDNGSFDNADAINGSTAIENTNYSISNPNDNEYVYVESMSMMNFDDTYKGSWVTNETSVKEFDMATATDDYLVYVADSKPSWKRWSNTYTKSEVDALIKALRTELVQEDLLPETTG